jgi:predicted 3-demethylubiquinone-9 3-methyltransferase (glyoxalase superfamily)
MMKFQMSASFRNIFFSLKFKLSEAKIKTSCLSFCMAGVITCLWFDREAEEAALFYVKVFSEGGRSANIDSVVRYGRSSSAAARQPEGAVMIVEFNLDGSAFLALNGGPIFKFSPAASFVINCKTQDEIDYFWEKLSEGGQEGQCGWIDYDKYGISWQIVPAKMEEIVGDPDPVKSERAMRAMLSMKKLDIEAIRRARDGAM